MCVCEISYIDVFIIRNHGVVLRSSFVCGIVGEMRVRLDIQYNM